MKIDFLRRKDDDVSRKDLRRDRRFKEELSQAWEVEKAPASYHRALEETYASLPDEIVVRRRPARTAGRALLGAAGVCAAACLVLFGLNLSQPRLAESIPGLGGVFRAINGEDEAVPETIAALSRLPVEDNGTILREALVTDDAVKITASVPFMGRESYDLYRYDDTSPLGTCARLENASGEGASRGALSTKYGADWAMEDCGETEGGPVTWTFLRDGETEGLVRLTVYESAYDTGGGRRVTAEFLVDLNAGMAAPSRGYEERGLVKVSPEECLATQRMEALPYYIAGTEVIDSTGSHGAYYRVEMFLPLEKGLEDPTGVTLYLYKDGELASTFSLPEEGTAVRGGTLLQALGSGLPWKEGGGGLYADTVTDGGRTGERYRHLAFAVPLSFTTDWEARTRMSAGDVEVELTYADGIARRGPLLDPGRAADGEQKTASLEETADGRGVIIVYDSRESSPEEGQTFRFTLNDSTD